MCPTRTPHPVPSPAIPPPVEPTRPPQSENEGSLSLVAQVGGNCPIRTPAELVECLGGEQRVAYDCMTSVDGVRHWLKTDLIPNGWQLRMFVRAVAAGRVFDQHGMDRIFSITPEVTQAIADRVPWSLSADPAPPRPPPYWERLRSEPAERRDDLAYRSAPMLLSASQAHAVSSELRQLVLKREKLRVAFVDLEADCDKAEANNAVSVEAYAELDERRNEALSELCAANDEVLLFEPCSISDLGLIVAMARHQLESGDETREEFLGHLLSSVERLVLEVGHE